jgi:flagellar basal body-associated protein FliL
MGSAVVDRARTLLVVLVLAAMAMGVFSLPGVAIFAWTSNSSTAETLVQRPALVAGIGSGTFLAVLVICLAGLIRLTRVARAAPEAAERSVEPSPPAGV